MESNSWLGLAVSGLVVRRATQVAIVVGTILMLINHGDALAAGDITGARIAKILLTYAVPYLVSTYSSVLALRGVAARGHVPSKS